MGGPDAQLAVITAWGAISVRHMDLPIIFLQEMVFPGQFNQVGRNSHVGRILHINIVQHTVVGNYRIAVFRKTDSRPLVPGINFHVPGFLGIGKN